MVGQCRWEIGSDYGTGVGKELIGEEDLLSKSNQS